MKYASAIMTCLAAGSLVGCANPSLSQKAIDQNIRPVTDIRMVENKLDFQEGWSATYGGAWHAQGVANHQSNQLAQKGWSGVSLLVQTEHAGQVGGHWAFSPPQSGVYQISIWK